MKNTISAILILLFAITASADLDSKKSEYKDSCQKAALTYLTDTSEFDDNRKTVMAAIVSCKEIMTDLDSRKKWDLVKTPTFDGCSDAIRLLIPKGSTEKFEKSQRAKYCAKFL